MDRDPHTSNIHLDAMARTEGNAPEPRVPDSLNRDAGKDAKDCKDHEGEKVSQHHDPHEEGKRWHRHLAAQAPSAARASAQSFRSISNRYHRCHALAVLFMGFLCVGGDLICNAPAPSPEWVRDRS